MTSEIWLLLFFQIADALFLLRLTCAPIDTHVAAQRISRLGARAILLSIAATVLAFVLAALRSFSASSSTDANDATGRLSMDLAMCIGIPFVAGMWALLKLHRLRAARAISGPEHADVQVTIRRSDQIGPE